MKYQFEHFKSADYIKKETGVDFSFPAHLHQSFELIIIRSGSMTVEVDAKKYELSKNEAVLIFPNQVHSLLSVKSEHTLFIFSPFIVAAYSSRVSGRVPENNKFTLSENMADMLNELNDSSPTEIKKGILYYICGKFDENAEYKLRDAKNDTALYKMFRFVENNYTKQCTLRGAAKEIGMNYAYLSRIFNNCVGITFNEYVNLMRLNHTCYLMDNTNAPIIQCALESGYNSMHTFERNFKELYGMTPIEYRNNDHVSLSPGVVKNV